MQGVGFQSWSIAGFWILFAALQGDGNIVYLNQKTLDLPIEQIKLRAVDFESEISVDTLYQYLSADGFPVHYSRNIRTNVCFDNKCRLLDIIVYWNLTGRYLGFELPEEEYLSKTDHDPFTPEEYERLNELLANPVSPLGRYSYNELILESSANTEEVDGVSGATSKEVLEFVVEGAAYTTHKLYQVIYGPTQAEIVNWTRESFGSEYLRAVLHAGEYSDKIWVLENMRGELSKYPELKPDIVEFIKGTDFTLSEKAIHVLVSTDLRDEWIQEELGQLFIGEDFGKRRWILELFLNADDIIPQIPELINAHMMELEVPIVVKVLEIYTKHQIHTEETQAVIKKLSESTNSYLANKAKSFLNGSL